MYKSESMDCQMKNISVLVSGYGSMGRRHVENLLRLGIDQVYVCDIDESRVAKADIDKRLKAFSSLESAIEQVTPIAVIVCTPPNLHVDQALVALSHGAHVFIEKPLSNSLDKVDMLTEKACSESKVVQVGYNWRFHEGLQKINRLLGKQEIGKVLSVRSEFGQYLPDWRPWQDYRQSYTAKSSMGGGIILDASHEIDYLRWFLGEIGQVYCWSGIQSDLNVDAEDTASMIFRFESGCVGELHLDFIQRTKSRNCKIIGSEGTIFWDNNDQEVNVFTSFESSWRKFDVSSDTNQKYLKEMASFLDCIATGREPVVGVGSARRTLEVALACQKSSQLGTSIKLPL